MKLFKTLYFSLSLLSFSIIPVVIQQAITCDCSLTETDNSMSLYAGTPTATLNAENITSSSMDVIWAIENYDMGSNYYLSVFNTETQSTAENYYVISTSGGSYHLTGLEDGTQYKISLKGEYMIDGDLTTQTISYFYVNTAPIIAVYDLTNPMFYAFWGGWIAFSSFVGIIGYNYFRNKHRTKLEEASSMIEFKRKTNSSKKNHRQRKRNEYKKSNKK